MSDLTLYYTPGACSLSPHIALREADLVFQLVRVDLRTKKLADSGEDWIAINPKGYVPALRLADGQLLTEGAVIVQYIADLRPDAHLMPRAGMERYRQLEWLNFIATELHKGMAPLYNVLANEDHKTQVRERVRQRFGTIATAVQTKPYLGGDRFSVADGYAFYVTRFWQRFLNNDLAATIPELVDYYQRLAARPAVAAALEVEGIKA